MVEIWRALGHQPALQEASDAAAKTIATLMLCNTLVATPRAQLSSRAETARLYVTSRLKISIKSLGSVLSEKLSGVLDAAKQSCPAVAIDVADSSQSTAAVGECKTSAASDPKKMPKKKLKKLFGS